MVLYSARRTAQIQGSAPQGPLPGLPRRPHRGEVVGSGLSSPRACLVNLRRHLSHWVAAAAVGCLATACGRDERASEGPDVVAARVEAPIVRGRPEGCLICHAGITGLDASHRPEQIGCAACHGGDVTSRVAAQAHVGMVLIPGQVSDAAQTCAQATCHAAIQPRIERSIMTTMAGVIAVNRRVFGEPERVPVGAASGAQSGALHGAPHGAPPHVTGLGKSPADSHLRQLCASCHLGQPKTEWGPIGELSRGGGCNACHLAYDSTALRQLDAYLATAPAARTGIPMRHPSFTIAVDNGRCFGCHSRSARIATNYEGWHELRDAPSVEALAADARAPRPQYRLLEDGRYFTRVTPDVHATRGMDCIDCHTAGEVMGTGAVVAHARDQLQVRCEDCHAPRYPSVAVPHADAETGTLAALRGWTFRPSDRFVTSASGAVLANVITSPDSGTRLRRKRTGAWSPLRPPRAVCTQGSGHRRLTCSTCHTAWAPRCATCHTRYVPDDTAYDHLDGQDVRGAWEETSGPYLASPPTLGIRWNPRDAAHPNGVVDTFIPGMILDIDASGAPGAPAGAAARIFRRLYARTAAHTTTRTARSCQSCHADPVALGVGSGTLRYVVSGSVGQWRFVPAERQLADGLPADAWTGFLTTRTGTTSTRDDVRPFLAEEQRRILEVGACLTCHAGDSRVMQRALVDYRATRAARAPRCVVPTWP